MTLGLAMAGFEKEPYGPNGDRNIKNLYEDLGFDVSSPDNYVVKNYGVEDNDTVGIAMAHKTIYDSDKMPVTLLAVTLRGGGYGNGGWAGNLEVGYETAYHNGFYRAADSVANQIQRYLENHPEINSKTLRVWLTGYSRSAATANLASQLLSIRGICKRANIYTYTFATPSNMLISSFFSTKYNNIFNIVNPLDIVTMVPPLRWEFGKQGTTYYTPYFAALAGASPVEFDETFSELADADYMCVDGQPTLTNNLIDMLLESFVTRTKYYEYGQEPLTGFVVKDYSRMDSIFCGKTTCNELVALIKNKKFGKAAKKIAAVISHRKNTYSYNDPYGILLDNLWGLLTQLAGNKAFNIVGTTAGVSDADFVMDIITGTKKSAALMQHWPEVYMAWMLTCDENNLTQTNTYSTKVAAVKCPVDVEVYDEEGNLVARTVTETYSVVDDETGETYTDTFTMVDSEVTSLEVSILGDNKYFVLPDGQEYRIEIVTNEDYSDGDTMTYSVTEYSGASQTTAVIYENVALSADSAFSAQVSVSEDVENCTTISDGTQVLEPTRIENTVVPSHAVSDLNVERTDNQYTVFGELSADETVILFCATYDADGKMLSAGSQTIASPGENGVFSLDIAATDEDLMMKVFVLDADFKPLDESLILYL